MSSLFAPNDSTSGRFLRAPHRTALPPGAGYTLDAFAPKGHPRVIFGDPWRVATARGVRASPGRRCSPGPFALVKSDRESLLPAGSRRFPPPLPLCRGSRPTVRRPRHARRACRRAREHSWTRARRRQRISPPLPSPRTRPMSNPRPHPRTRRHPRDRGFPPQPPSANERCSSTRWPRWKSLDLHPPSRHAAATVRAARRPRPSARTTTTPRRRTATRPPPPPPPLLPPPPRPPRPCPRRESRPGRRTILDRTRDEGNRRASGRRRRRILDATGSLAAAGTTRFAIRFVRRGRRRRAAPPRFPPRRRGDCPERECASRTRVRRPSRGRGGRSASGNGISRSGARGAGYLPARRSSCASGVTRTFARVFCGAGGWRTPTLRVHFSI